jgi:hypothetical protein
MSPSGVQDSGLGDGKTVLMVPSVCVCVKRVCRKELSVCTAAQDRRGSGPGQGSGLMVTGVCWFAHVAVAHHSFGSYLKQSFSFGLTHLAISHNRCNVV